MSRKEEVANAVKLLLKQCNAMGGGDLVATVIADEVGSDHRTIQQSFWRSIRSAAIGYAVESDKKGSDMRYAGAVEFCKNVAADETCLPYI